MNATRTYLLLSALSSGLFSMAFIAMSLYEVTIARLSPLQLVLVGTMLELTVLLCEVPTGIIADVRSRRLSVILGHFIIALGFMLEGLFPFFGLILLAQFAYGLGYTFTSGATQAWLSDEIGEQAANQAFLRANRYSLVGSLVGMLAAVALGAFTSAAVPIVVSGAGRVLLAGLLMILMKETRFKGAKPQARSTFQHMLLTLRQGIAVVRSRPAMLAILGVALFFGLYSEGFDRLWVRHLLDQFSLPRLLGNNEVAFFGVLRAMAMLTSIAATALVEKRLDTRSPRAIGRLMFAITLGVVGAIIAFALSPFLGVTLGLYLFIATLRNLAGPLMDAWMNQRLAPEVRATVLSMSGQADAVGQIAGGPAIGLLASSISVRLAIAISGSLLSPALGFIALADRAQRKHSDVSDGHSPQIS